MPKLAIYVPKKEMKVIEKWRNQINFSKVFMGALRQEIGERTRVVETDEQKLQAAARFYKRELAENSSALLEFGHRLGVRQVMDCKLGPDVIRRLHELRDLDSWKPDELNIIQTSIGAEMSGVDKALNDSGYDESERPTWRLIVFRGYLAGVAAAWQQVCKHM